MKKSYYIIAIVAIVLMLLSESADTMILLLAMGLFSVIILYKIDALEKEHCECNVIKEEPKSAVQ